VRESGRRLATVVLATLAAGAIAAAPGTTPGNAAAGQRSRPQGDAELESFLKSYFATWSSGDMAAYKAHFHPYATITSVQKGRIYLAVPRDPFVEIQSKLIRDAKGTMIEQMTSYTADVDETAATVEARWLLEKGDEKQTGIDRFILIRDESGRWKIVALLFYPSP
jgi:hypothetical protein